MTALPFARRFLAEAARTPVNLLVLVLVPVVFVVVAAGPLADAAALLGGSGGPAVQIVTAGWAAGFIAAIAMYFQTRAARAADRRLILAGLAPYRLAAARMATGLALALLATAAALLALQLRTGLGDDPQRVPAGTLMYALIYLAIGALIGATVASPVNGTVLVLFVWILDVFFGPVMGAVDRAVTRVLPTHFVTLWMVDAPSGHGGRIGDLGWALAWAAAAAAVSWTVITSAGRVVRPRRPARHGSATAQLAAGVRAGLREAGRNRVLWALLIAVPTVFILLAVATTPEEPTQLTVRESGRTTVQQAWLPDIHGGTMAPIAIASLATLAGLFTILDARAGDRRLALAGFRPAGLLASRLTVVALGALLATVASLAVTATVFEARQWGLYIAASILIALTYGLVGVLLGPLFGRVGGVLIAFLVPFIDLGIGQSPMLRPDPPGWAHALPGYGATRVVIDAAVTPGFDETGPLLIALAWLTGLTLAAAGLFRHAIASTAAGRAGGGPR
ncbi:ABC transporter permease [Streptomyces purpurogeneiscleroticus]|uniref:ABC transporter permease n=1 Tax=Streptomyces purpurogeneiscleroticus TaxID=68259 RepID=UPI001CBE806D|nr:ABC transporter permease [Streptomyces purpurogeneiscleroticus]MBZ4018588.1 ABC transporter permease [Streptomyces purpurogeneiscleroticus]